MRQVRKLRNLRRTDALQSTMKRAIQLTSCKGVHNSTVHIQITIQTGDKLCFVIPVLEGSMVVEATQASKPTASEEVAGVMGCFVNHRPASMVRASFSNHRLATADNISCHLSWLEARLRTIWEHHLIGGTTSLFGGIGVANFAFEIRHNHHLQFT